MTSPDVTGDRPAGAGTEAHADEAETMTGDIAGHDAGAGGATADAGRTARLSTASAAHEDRADGRSRPAGYGAGRAEARQRIVTARRRMLLILVTLTVAAIGMVGLNLAAWWVAVPPILMLGGYLMLLREASRADRERVLLDAAAYRDEQRQRQAEEQEAARRAAEVPAAPAAPAVPPAARVIDICERVRDEDGIYDQYADGTRRAVGD